MTEEQRLTRARDREESGALSSRILAFVLSAAQIALGMLTLPEAFQVLGVVIGSMILVCVGFDIFLTRQAAKKRARLAELQR